MISFDTRCSARPTTSSYDCRPYLNGNSETCNRDPEALRCHLEQHAPRLGGNATHRPAVDLNRVGAARAALVDGDVGGAHDAGRGRVGDVEFVGHHLAERRAGALSAISLADVERRGIVLMDDDP